MKWIKQGRVYSANGESDWAQTHAYIPTPLLLEEERIRVYAAFLDRKHIGRVGFVDLDPSNPLKVLEVSKEPVLDIGEPGTFDDSGVTPISIVNSNGKYFMYYVGWQRGVNVRYFLYTGLAISKDGGYTFKRYSKVPILDRSDDELFVRTAANVLHEDGIYKMRYVAGSKWINIMGKDVPTYNIRYLESEDGISWDKKGRTCMDISNKNEIGFGRPFIIKENNLYKMWYSIRTINNSYRLGYAESIEGMNWIRKDAEVGIDVSKTGWDSEMICFSSIIDIKGDRFMFYNGNNYGETGFGVALLEVMK